MCKCNNVEIGSHDATVIVHLSSHAADKIGKRCISVDHCLSHEICSLLDMGIITLGCCCGHNKKPPYIQVAPDSIKAMHELGYVLCEEQSQSGFDDCFIPKSV